jgi:hypothetical protein
VRYVLYHQAAAVEHLPDIRVSSLNYYPEGAPLPEPLDFHQRHARHEAPHTDHLKYFAPGAQAFVVETLAALDQVVNGVRSFLP